MQQRGIREKKEHDTFTPDSVALHPGYLNDQKRPSSFLWELGTFFLLVCQRLEPRIGNVSAIGLGINKSATRYVGESQGKKAEVTFDFCHFGKLKVKSFFLPFL